ncbi:MAG TPA: hypothetical protein VHJ82_01920 [Actinomycetota bacterium]|nr:hypothetical protein [Actinomycetota bacterium]
MSYLGKVILTIMVVLGVLSYAVIVDWGVSAGRVHAGVAVQDVDLGGLTEQEAADALADRGTELGADALVFVRDTVQCSFFPFEVGWKPKPFQTAREAMQVGRVGLPFAATLDRVRAWFGGVKVRWADKTSAKKVGEFLDECEADADDAGVLIDRGKFRFKIRRALIRWPRKDAYRIPVLGE